MKATSPSESDQTPVQTKSNAHDRTANAHAAPVWLGILTAVVACVALCWLLYPAGANAITPLQLVYRVSLTIAGLMVLGMIMVSLWPALHRERVAGSELRRILDILPRVRMGELPIDELKKIEGPLLPLSVELQEMLHELRQQRAAIAAVEAELPQRVASRTSALERTIGSLRQQAIRDPMTGLYNRRLLDEHLPPIIDRCRLKKSHLSLLMIDVDHFKILNDTLGHAAGDELLRDIAQIIRCTIRENDVAFRYGGDEFVVVLEGFDAEAGQALGDRLVSLVDALTETVRVEPKPRLSIGVATIQDIAKATPAALLQEADRLLYEEKRSRKREQGMAVPARIAV